MARKQAWFEIWDFTRKFGFRPRIWISFESSYFARNFRFRDFSEIFQILMTKFEIKILWPLVKPLQLKVLWPLVKPLPFQSFPISKLQLLNRYLLLPISLKGYLLQKFREKICERLTEHLPSLLVLVQGFQGAPLDAEHTILYLQSMTSSNIGSECVINPL